MKLLNKSRAYSISYKFPPPQNLIANNQRWFLEFMRNCAKQINEHPEFRGFLATLTPAQAESWWMDQGFRIQEAAEAKLGIFYVQQLLQGKEKQLECLEDQVESLRKQVPQMENDYKKRFGPEAALEAGVIAFE